MFLWYVASATITLDRWTRLCKLWSILRYIQHKISGYSKHHCYDGSAVGGPKLLLVLRESLWWCVIFCCLSKGVQSFYPIFLVMPCLSSNTIADGVFVEWIWWCLILVFYSNIFISSLHSCNVFVIKVRRTAVCFSMHYDCLLTEWPRYESRLFTILFLWEMANLGTAGQRLLPSSSNWKFRKFANKKHKSFGLWFNTPSY